MLDLGLLGSQPKKKKTFSLKKVTTKGSEKITRKIENAKDLAFEKVEKKKRLNWKEQDSLLSNTIYKV